jgi:Tfp pilus assembly protein FimV
MATGNGRHSRVRHEPGESILSPEQLVSFGSNALVADEIRPATEEGIAYLQDRLAKLEVSRRILQKDVAVKDAYLAALRADLLAKEHEVASLRAAVSALHHHIEQTLSQPRYRAVDAINRALHCVAPLHRFLKRRLIRLQSADRRSGDRMPQQ